MKVAVVLRLLHDDGWQLVATVEVRMRFAIVIEQAEGIYSAFVPDLPGCVATGATVQEVETNIREAIEFHLEAMREDGVEVPVPQSKVEYIEVAA